MSSGIDNDTMMSEPVRELYYAALEILDDFDTFGEVLQVDDNGEYGEDTAITKLRKALEKMEG